MRIPVLQIALILSAAGCLPRGELAAGEQQRAFYEDLLPGRPVAVVSVENAGALVRAIEQTAFRNIADRHDASLPDFKKLQQRLRFLAAVATGLPAGEQQALLKGGCAAAVLEGNGGHLPFAVVFDISHLSADARQTLEKTLTASLRLALYGRAKMHDAGGGMYNLELGPADDQKFSIIFLDKAIIAGFDSDIAANAPPAGLPGDTLFRRISRELPLGKDFSGYVDIHRLLGELDKRYPSTQRKAALKRFGIGSVQAAGFHSTAGGGMLDDRLFFALAEQRENWLSHLPTQSAVLEAAQLVPPEFGLFVAADFGRGTQLYEALRAVLRTFGGDRAVERFDAECGAFEQFGFNIADDLFASMAGEIFFAADIQQFADVIDSGFDARVTPYMMGWRVRDDASFAGAVDRLLDSEYFRERLGIERRTVRSGRNTLVHITSSVEERLDAAYVFLGGYFVYSPRLKTLEQAVQAFDTGRSLKSSGEYSSLQAELGDEANLTAFAATDVLYRELLSAYETRLDEGSAGLIRSLVSQPERKRLGGSMLTAAVKPGGVLISMRSPVGLWLGCYTASAFIKDAGSQGEDH